MSAITASQLKAGYIFGDIAAGEYVYMPAGEVGMASPVCILETPQGRRDVSLDEAVELVLRLSLKPVRHPRLGYRSC
ncbi:hypothetical protein TcarDRAFT_1141 [Thermosinus carboxydivorans Nor1]|uniref:Uncharacterized protein n=1 Tax=Thermosinus carboxydivorans Nor1 TaxID=401526 RepID=A1HQC8_9FIRM|nr:hypothetical protein [Thermosinus carboxydivorans]EAX47735.1 hypothetical protein TcarDRAFT_1141 [Thermosinus carboxydivorans Nor1]